ncbi:MAG: hypothetical protein WKF62_05720 [Solirubrobacterales bacterium]
MRGRKFAGWLVVGALSVAGPVASADAGGMGATQNLGKAGPLDYLRTKRSEVQSQAGPPTACKGADQITGGGAAIGGKPAKAHLNSSGPVFNDEAWLGEGRTASGSETVASWAICGDAETTQVASTDSFGQVQYNAGFSCNAGESLSGGIRSAGGDVLLNGAFPDDSAGDTFDWIDSYQNDVAATATITSAVICSAGYPVVHRAASQQVKPGEAAKSIARCEHGEVVAGGGVSMTRQGIPQGDVWAQATRPWDSKDDKNKTPEDGWFAKSLNDTDQKVTLTSYASCVPRNP